MQLTEWERSPSIAVAPEVRRTLERVFDATVSSGAGWEQYVVRPGGVVGTVTVSGQVVTVRPKIDIDRVLFMVAYAHDPYRWQEELSTVGSVESLVDGMAALFVQACSPLLVGGLLRDYRRVDVDDRVVRGKIRWSVQARRHPPIPLALRHDVHDDDILENQILRAACQVLRRATLSGSSALGVSKVWSALRELSPLRDAAGASESVMWTRRNLHYRPALELARVILGGDMADVVGGDVPVTGFTLVMHEVFERFLRTSLRTVWEVSAAELPDTWSRRGLSLDERGEVGLEPDLGWVDGSGSWRFVGDAKYKKDSSGGGRSADIYQALAYAVATGLPDATLFYAEGGQDRDHFVPAVAKTVRLRHLDLTRPPGAVLGQIARIIEGVMPTAGAAGPEGGSPQPSHGPKRPRSASVTIRR